MAGTITRPQLRGADAARALVLGVLREHAESLLRVARHHSLCADDAQDAYQRGVEIFLRHAATLDESEAHKWLHTVIKHEAMRLRAQRSRHVAAEEHDLDGHESSRLPTADEQVASFDLMTRSAEALQRLKPQELRALWLRAQGHSYAEIAELEGWTATKVNRCLTEGRRSFLERVADIASGEECRRWEPVLSAVVDGEATARELSSVRPHLRHCAACRARVRELRESTVRVAALLPVPVPVFAGAAPDHGGLLARAYEAAAGLQERVVVSATKLQLGVEASLSAKVAVAAAGAAMIGGGGVALERAVDAPAAKRAGAPAPAPARSRALTPPSTAVRLARRPDDAAAATRTTSTAAQPVARPQPTRRERARRTARTEFGVAASGARAASVQTASQEFAQPAPSTAPAATSSSTATPPPAPASRDAQTAAAEFGG